MKLPPILFFFRKKLAKCFTSTNLHEMTGKLAIMCWKLIKGEVPVSVVGLGRGDSHGVPHRDAILQQALGKNYHDTPPICARYLREWTRKYYNDILKDKGLLF